MDRRILMNDSYDRTYNRLPFLDHRNHSLEFFDPSYTNNFSKVLKNPLWNKSVKSVKLLQITYKENYTLIIIAKIVY